MAANAQILERAQDLVRAKSYDEAVTLLKRYLASSPNDLKARQLLGLAAYRGGDYVTAEAAYRIVTTSSPGNVVALYSLGITLTRLGRVEEAKRCFTAVLKIDPFDAPARERLSELRSSPETHPVPQEQSHGAATSQAEPVTATTGRSGPTEPQSFPLDAAPAAGPSSQRSGSRDGTDTERLTPGNLLRAGQRRLSSFAGQFLLAAVLILGGGTLIVSYEPGRLNWVAERVTFPSPGYYEELLVDVGNSPLREGVLRDLDRARADVAQMSERLDGLLVLAALVSTTLGVLFAIHALLAAGFTHYEVHERRIDVARGVLNRQRNSVWLYEITDVQLRQPPWLTLTGNSEIRISTEDESTIKITGFGSGPEQVQFWRNLRDAAVVERRAIRSWWG